MCFYLKHYRPADLHQNNLSVAQVSLVRANKAIEQTQINHNHCHHQILYLNSIKMKSVQLISNQQGIMFCSLSFVDYNQILFLEKE